MDDEKKVTLANVYFRLLLIVAPIVGPYIFDASKGAQVVVPALWLICLGPFFLIPIQDIDKWEEDAKKYYWIFQSIGKIYLALIIASAFMYLLFGKGRY
jgi:hypothetical protein